MVALNKELSSIQDKEEGTSKRKRTSEESSKKNVQTKKPKTNSEKDLNQWELLTETWMRGLLEIPGSSYLTTLPCIKEEKIMPNEVFNIINCGRGKIIFYANVVHIKACPRFLIHGSEIHMHRNDSAVAVCVTDGKSHRLFVRCFSEKCLHLCKSGFCKWEEYKQSHYTKYVRLSLAATKKTQPVEHNEDE